MRSVLVIAYVMIV